MIILSINRVVYILKLNLNLTVSYININLAVQIILRSNELRSKVILKMLGKQLFRSS